MQTLSSTILTLLCFLSRGKRTLETQAMVSQNHGFPVDGFSKRRSLEPVHAVPSSAPDSSSLSWRPNVTCAKPSRALRCSKCLVPTPNTFSVRCLEPYITHNHGPTLKGCPISYLVIQGARGRCYFLAFAFFILLHLRR